MLIDSHCHLDHHYYSRDLKEVIERAKKNNLKFIITNGIDYKTNKISLELAEKYAIVKPALGFYPEDALDREGYFQEKNSEKTIISNSLQRVQEQIEKNKEKIIAIGEIGLDLFHGKNIKKQSEDLNSLIKLAIKINKPVIIHTRKAEKETLEILNKSSIDPNKVILHCFSANQSLIKEAIDNGYNFSIPTNVVRAENFQHLVKLCPLNKILTETDGPYLSPFKNSDKNFNRNEPSYIKESIIKIAEIKDLSIKETEKAIYENFKRIFSIT